MNVNSRGGVAHPGKMDSMITEKQFEGQIKDLARLLGWRYYHTWTSFHSPKGFLDCVMVRRPRLIFAELKSQGGLVTQEQLDWIDDLRSCKGVEAYLWRPSDFDEIIGILRRED